jgi:hypothetical protein
LDKQLHLFGQMQAIGYRIKTGRDRCGARWTCYRAQRQHRAREGKCPEEPFHDMLLQKFVCVNSHRRTANSNHFGKTAFPS